MRRVMRRLGVLLGVTYLFSSIDRFNVAFAALSMNRDLGFSPTVFGTAVSAFFWTYVLLQLPSNLVLQRIGARKWLSFLVIMWSLISSGMVFIHDGSSFIVARILLGAAEAGFVPGVVYFATRWFPSRYRGQFTGTFAIWGVSSTIVGPLLAANLMRLDGLLGLQDWQWLYLVEGLVPLLLGALCFVVLADSPAHAKWLTGRERKWLTTEIERDEVADHAESTSRPFLRQLVTNRQILVLAVVCFGNEFGTWGLAYWMPLIMQEMGFSNVVIGYLSAIPGIIGCLAVYCCLGHSDRTGERLWHLAIPIVLGGAGLIVAALNLGNPVIALTGLCVSVAGIVTGTAMVWTLPGEYLPPRLSAAGIAVLLSFGNISGAIAPQLIGILKDRTGSYEIGLLALAAPLISCVALVPLLRKRSRAVACSPHVKAAQ